MNNEIIAARYPEMLRKGGSTNGKIIINFNEDFTLSQLNINKGKYQIKPIIHEMGFIIFIQFIIVKKTSVFENFENLIKQIKAPRVPIIPLKNKFFDNSGLANPKTKKCE